MTERGTRQRLVFGSVTAEVSLVKASAKPSEAKHETRRVRTAEVPLPTFELLPERIADDAVPDEWFDTAIAGKDFSGTPHPLATAPLDPIPPRREPDESLTPLPPAPPESASPPEVVDPFAGTTVRHGVHRPDGEWVDLTDALASIDERTRLDGLEVVATIPASSIPRERVRDAYYVCGADPATFKVLRLVYDALRDEHRAAAVKWTKRTNQALGIIVARAEPRALILLECEWAQNMKAPPPRASGPLEAEVSAGELAAAKALVAAFAHGPSALNDLRDERTAKRAELLTVAREGRLNDYAPPPEREAPQDLAERLLAAARS